MTLKLRMLSVAVLVSLAACGGGTTTEDAGTGGGTGGGMGGGTGGGGGTDAGSCATGETDCSGTCKNLQTDPANCNACGMACPSGAHSTATCTAGACGLTCATGFADCDGDASNGCEADLADPATCGTCSNACAGGANGTATCTAGTCGISCTTGFDNCDNNLANGCEADLTAPATCGSCGNACSGGANATATCTGGTCGLTCTTGFANCDMANGNGCEADLASPATCGTCMNACAGGANATATCTAGTCGISCTAGFDNCDNNATNGCEADLTRPVTCGSCGNTCGSGANQAATCFMGQCGTQCNTGWDNCDMNAANGCEANLTSPATCGSCSNACASGANGIAICGGGTCGVVCSQGFDNCDGNLANGCEANLAAPSSCGSCSNVCTTGQTCTTGTCSNCSVASTGTLVAGTPSASSLPANTPARLPVASCGGNGTENYEDVWELSVAAPTSMVIEALGSAPTPDGGVLDTVLWVRQPLCNASTDVACADDISGVTPINRGSRAGVYMPPGNYYVMVKQKNNANQGGSYTLNATATSPSSNSVCAGATPLTPGTTLTGQSTNGFGPKGGCVPAGSSGGLHWYSINVPAGNRLTVVTTPTAAPNNLIGTSVQFLTDCAATTCLTSGSATGANTRTWDNRTAAAQTVYVAVGSSQAGNEGTFDLNPTLTDLALSPNSQCTAPTTLTVGAPAITGETIQTGGVPLNTLCATSQVGPTRYYSVAVPAGATVAVTMTPNAFNGGLRIVDACPATRCTLFADNSSTSGAAETVRITNTGATTATYLVAASASTLTTIATYSIVATSVTNPANASCATAQPITAGVPFSVTTEAGGNPLDQVCLPTQQGYVKYYSIDVAAGSTLAVMANPALGGTTTLGANVGFRFFEGCGTAVCAGSSDYMNTATAPDNAFIVNSSSSTKSYIVAISSATTNPLVGTSGLPPTYNVTATVSPSGTNAVCSAAQTLTVSSSIAGEVTSGGTGPEPQCLNTTTASNGPGRYYSVSVPADGGIVVAATSTDIDLNVRGFNDCTATATCVVAGTGINRNTAPGTPANPNMESVLLTNPTGSPVTQYVRVGSPIYLPDAGVPVGTWGVETWPWRNYTKTNIAPACDDMTGATELLGATTTPAIADEVASATVALPFTLSFFSVPVNYYGVSSNGLVQFFPSASGTTSASGGNHVAIPNMPAPNGYATPFWDDMFPAATTSVRAATFGSGSARHLTVEFYDMALKVGGVAGAQRLRYQLKAFEGTNVIEYHYCTVMMADGGTTADLPDGGFSDLLLTGNSATVGIEDLYAVGGVLHSAGGGNNISPNTALRFTPQ